MSEFNVGDRVRIKPNYGGGDAVGYVNRVGTIVGKYIGFSQMVHKVQLEGDGPAYGHPYAHEITRVLAPAPAPAQPNLTREEWDVIHEALLWANNKGAADVWDKVNTWKYGVSNG